MDLVRRLKHLLIVAGLFALWLPGCGDRPSSGDCEKLLGHMVDLEIASAGSEASAPDQKKNLAKQKKDLTNVLRSDFMKQCEERTPGTFVACALRKNSYDKLADCDVSKD